MASRLDMTDPRLRSMVYSHYRGILGQYNAKANSILEGLPPERVCEDKGIGKQLESMIRQSSQIHANNTNGNTNNIPAGGGPPPPPPPPSAGSLPAVRIASEIAAKKNYEPPAAIQNAMMTKDKKPFTYTPGGLNLNEIRSPRMARRINRNAHTEDSCSQPQPAQTSPPSGPLPPSVLAAMQPQIAVPVFPPGGIAPPPPPPPCPPPPTAPTAPAVSSSRPDPSPARPEFLSDIANHPPLRPVGQAPRSFEPPPPPPLQVQLKPVSPKVPQDVAPVTPPSMKVQVPPPPMKVHIPPPPTSAPPLETQIPRPLPAVSTPPMPPKAAPPTPPTPSLNKSPAPWLTSRPAALHESPPPWTVRQPSVETPPPLSQPPLAPGHQPITRVIPIQIEGRNSATPELQGTQPASSQQQGIMQQQQPALNHRYVQQSPVTQQQHQQYAPPPVYQQKQPVQNQQQQKVYQPPQQQPPPQYQQQQSPQYQQSSPGYQVQSPQYQVQSPQYQVQSPQYQQPSPQYQQPPPQYQQEQQVKTRIIPIQFEEGNEQGIVPQTPPPAYTTQTSLNKINQNDNYPRSANGDATDGARRLQSQTSWPSNPIQSRSFRVLQKITGSEDEPNVAATAPAQHPSGDTYILNRVYPPQTNCPLVGDELNVWGSESQFPCYPNYWFRPPQTPEEQQQFWEHYNAMCAYMAHMNVTAMRCSPYPVYPYPPHPPYPSDTEDISNSSSDEMNFYGQMFKQMQQQQQLKQEVQERNSEHISSISETPTSNTLDDRTDLSSGSDTEVEEDSNMKGIGNALQSIRSVPNVNVYNQSSSESESESSEEEEEDEEAGTDSPYQLSVILEESELSSEDSKRISEKNNYESDNNSSTSTLNNINENNEDENAVKVRLPLQLKFSRSDNNEEVTTLIVGNSEFESSQSVVTEDGNNLIITNIVKDDSDPDVTATIVLRKKSRTEISDEKTKSESPVDFWKEINSEDEMVKCKCKEDDSKQDESDGHWEDDSSSTSLQTVKKGNSESENMSELEAAGTADEQEDLLSKVDVGKTAEEDETSSSEEEEEDSESCSDSSSSSEDESEHSNVFNDNEISQETRRKPKDEVLQSSKSFEESEEDDSGVTSDLSRHISETDTDPECGSELSKMSRCQRAATHSRLFKLLQEECAGEEEESDEPLAARKERLRLPLNGSVATGDDSLSSSSGINSPASPTVTDRLVKELVQSLLNKKKGRHFRKLPVEKLHAAALRILQEDMDPYDTGSTSDESNFFLSPVGNPQPEVTAPTVLDPETYGMNYYDYCNYYRSWDASCPNDYDIVPSKAFKSLQEQARAPSRGVPVRCPRTLPPCPQTVPSEPTFP